MSAPRGDLTGDSSGGASVGPDGAAQDPTLDGSFDATARIVDPAGDPDER